MFELFEIGTRSELKLHFSDHAINYIYLIINMAFLQQLEGISPPASAKSQLINLLVGFFVFKPTELKCFIYLSYLNLS